MASPGVFALSTERPFPGLRPFGPLDRAFFFGREAQFYALYRLINLSRFLAVIGNSGSGKSSLVRAGLLPLLEEESREPGGRQWKWVEMRPGATPLQSLSHAMARLAEDLSTTDDPMIASVRAERISYHVHGSSHGIAKAVAEVDPAGEHTIVLLVDQFEELFRFASSGAIGGAAPHEEARLREEASLFVQLLLEASRSPVARIHVVLTLRSDFIGDCARFHGLPEAVSATQFLVPSLTRDQREAVIRRPVALAGATIEPSLVEELLNDSGDEQDQLPVLQHCLLRLWERAGGRQAETAADAPLGRHISRREYDEIHRLKGALSQHADEILAVDLAGSEPQVAYVFRALSDLDRDGRATKRGLSFEQLAAETAIDAPELTKILDRFRADDCSFLTPSPATTPALEAKTPIDVGHEALLRHWERVAGMPGATGERDDPRPQGWLSEERRAGQRYQALVAMASSDEGENALLSADQVSRYWTWWNERRRTEAWAARYGGHHARVERLLNDSKAAFEAERLDRHAEATKRRWTRIAGGVLAAVAVLFAGGIFFTQQQYRAAREQREVAQQTTEIAVKTVGRTVDAVQQTQKDGSISIAASRALLAKIAEPLGTQDDPPPDVMALNADILVAFSDALKVAGDTPGALERARKAAEYAQALVEIDPERKDWQRLVFASAFRIGDAALSLGFTPQNIELALENYRRGETVVGLLAAAEPERADRHFDLAFMRNKVGEAMQVGQRLEEAIAQFRSALEPAAMAVKLAPDNNGYRAYLAASYVKIAGILRASNPPDLDGALENYETALTTYRALYAKSPDNDIIRSNLATALRGHADVLVLRWQAGDFEAAVNEYNVSISLLNELRAEDPTNIIWMTVLAANFAHLAAAYEKREDLPNALANYREELALRQKAVEKDPSNPKWQASLAATQAKVDELTLKAEQAGNQPTP